MRSISPGFRLRFARLATYRTSVSVSFKSFTLRDFAAARGFINAAEARIQNALRFIEQAFARFLCRCLFFPLRAEARRHHPKFNVLDNLRPKSFFEITQN